MANERITENIIRNLLRNAGYYDNTDIIVEEQSSNFPDIDKLLRNASKRGGGKGYPEFIIRSKNNSSFVIVIECKANIKFHESSSLNKYADYAVDGAILYASFLSKSYDVLAIGASGQNLSELIISHHIIPKGCHEYTPIFGKKIHPFDEYLSGYLKSDVKFNQDYEKLLDYAKYLNSILHENKIKESQRSLLISGILMALGNVAFKNGYSSHKKADQICSSLLNTVADEFSNAGLPEYRIKNLRQAFSFISTNTTLTTDREFFISLIKGINDNINNFMRTYKYFDTIGQFYIEFLRYANNDKGLGIVLTPPHITELFCDIVAIDKDSIVFDNCCGTGGFLISAMNKMIKCANLDITKIDEIKKNQLVGIEYQDDIYALGVSNMIIHGDGKTNFIMGDCFELNEIKEKYSPTIGFLNPPYKSEKNNPEELDFVINNLNALKKGGKCVAIIPLSCAIATSGDLLQLKKHILHNHTLEAVMSMPEELFHNSKVNVVTCIIVLTAHIPHPNNKKTWLGYWRNDGFEKTKTNGRIDLFNKWEGIKSKWLSAYVNRECVDDISITRELSASDEWCAEAYMLTDYSKITSEQFNVYVKQYLSFRLLHNLLDVKIKYPKKPTKYSSKMVKVSDIFIIGNGLASSQVKVKEEVENTEDIRYIRPSQSYSGSIAGYVDKATIDKKNIYPDNTIYVSTDGQGSHTYSYLSSFEFIPNSNVSVLIPKIEMTIQEKIYYTICITANRFRYSYGRKPKGDRLKEILIPECPPAFVYEDIFSKIFDDWKKLIN